MNRRRLLALLGSAGLGGCLGVRSESPSTGTATTTGETTTGAEAPAVGTAEPGAGPPFDSDVQRFVYSPEVGVGGPIAISPAEQSGELPRAELSFTLANGTDVSFTTNFYAWKVWKRVDGEWFYVAPQEWPEPAMRIQPGDSHTWELTVDNADLDRPIPRAEGTEDLTVVGLGAGTYAFGVDGWFESEDYQNAVGLAARFELTGEPLELTPVGLEDAAVERDGETVLVDDYPDDEEYRANYTVTRVESPETEPSELIVEQVLRDTPLRNALAHFEPGVGRVRLQSETGTFPPFGVDEPRFVRYEGRDYRIETEWEGDPPE